MIAQVRLYTINRGKMESWLQLFNDRLDEALTAAEAVVDGGLADPGRGGDLLQRRAQPTPPERGDGGGADLGDVAGRIGAQRRSHRGRARLH